MFLVDIVYTNNKPDLRQSHIENTDSCSITKVKLRCVSI